MNQLSLVEALLCADCGLVPPRPRKTARGKAPSRCECCHKEARLKSDRDSATRGRAVRAETETPADARDRKAYFKQWRVDNKHRQVQHRWTHRLKRYGITEEKFEQMWAEQEGCCKICGTAMERQAEKRQSNECVIDHDHETDEVRGLLCRACNAGIGLLNEDVSKLEAAIRYLNEANMGRNARGAA